MPESRSEERSGPEPSAVLVWAPMEVERSSNEDVGGWWIAGAPRGLENGERAVVYQSQTDQGVVGLFDFSLASFEHPDLGWAGFGRWLSLGRSIPRSALLANRRLTKVFRHLRGRRYLDEPAQRQALVELIGDLPAFAQLDEPLPDPEEEDWEWTPAARGGWGLEHSMRDALIEDSESWRRLGFRAPPVPEHHPPRSTLRTDLWAPGIVGECKLMAGRAALAQLIEYLDLYDQGDRENAPHTGHLIAAHGYTVQVADEVADHAGISLWLCHRDGARPRLERVC